MEDNRSDKRLAMDLGKVYKAREDAYFKWMAGMINGQHKLSFLGWTNLVYRKPLEQ